MGCTTKPSSNAAGFVTTTFAKSAQVSREADHAKCPGTGGPGGLRVQTEAKCPEILHHALSAKLASAATGAGAVNRRKLCTERLRFGRNRLRNSPQQQQQLNSRIPQALLHRSLLCSEAWPV